ncbi:unnamed protein product [Adineta steineri]|uniref:Proteasome subunit alpha type n=3 Tax=Adineta steineri TaxID=433720 RepID=A0A814Z9B0_9BILA|nr:unnamed protein product [Adineta steineri]CAF1240559.1 unnamed protein product [Adineta steineri]
MARRYDTRATIFSPEGRLYQVEYALEAISHSGASLGILAENGVVLAGEKRNVSPLLDDVKYSEKIYKIHDDLCCSVSGITSDANVLINELRMIGQRYLLTYQEPAPIEYIVSRLCNIKQAYTQFGGKRPFGVSFLYMGWDKHYGYQLYQSDPSGNFGGWKATCVGHNSQTAISILKQEYKIGETQLNDALRLAIRVFSKTLDTTKLTPEKIEIAVLQHDDKTNQTTIRMLKDEELTTLIKQYEDEQSKLEADRQKQQQTTTTSTSTVEKGKK